MHDASMDGRFGTNVLFLLDASAKVDLAGDCWEQRISTETNRSIYKVQSKENVSNPTSLGVTK